MTAVAGHRIMIYVAIGLFQAVTIGMIAWGTGWIVWHRLRTWRASRRRRRAESG